MTPAPISEAPLPLMFIRDAPLPLVVIFDVEAVEREGGMFYGAPRKDVDVYCYKRRPSVSLRKPPPWSLPIIKG